MEPRIGDAEREGATSRLGDHFAAGRLDHEEYDERLDAIWSARSRADLDQLFLDLPRALAPVATTRPERRTSAPGWRLPLAMFLIGAILFALVLGMPWWGWLIALVVLMKRPWARGHGRSGKKLHEGGPGRSCA